MSETPICDGAFDEYHASDKGMLDRARLRTRFASLERAANAMRATLENAKAAFGEHPDTDIDLAQRISELRDEARGAFHQHTRNVELLRRAERAEKERDEADRRAGAAERELEFEKDSSSRRASWLRTAKQQWGVHENVSFDVVWEEALKIRAQRDAAIERVKVLEAELAKKI